MAVYKQEFYSIGQFYDYICKTSINDAFRWKQLSSSKVCASRDKFTGTHTFDEASVLMRNGWTDMAKRLNTKLQATAKPAPIMQRKHVLGVSGFQPIVPLYLAGVPANMVDVRMVPVKSKIINITKSINYHCGTSAETIIDESVKAMQVVKQLEAQGYRCNLNVALGVCADQRHIVAKVCIKRAGEKLNVSKLAFPMVHPSMLRRLFFRYIEVCPDVTKGFTNGYGMPVAHNTMSKIFQNDIVLPAIWDVEPDAIRTLDDLQASF